jgi:hypothetical protein
MGPTPHNGGTLSTFGNPQALKRLIQTTGIEGAVTASTKTKLTSMLHGRDLAALTPIYTGLWWMAHFPGRRQLESDFSFF